jgi:hypothetical protein
MLRVSNARIFNKENKKRPHAGVFLFYLGILTEKACCGRLPNRSFTTELHRMAEVDTVRADFRDTPCDDCGKKEVVCMHWGLLVPPGWHLFLCDICFAARQAHFEQTGDALPLLLFNYVDLLNPPRPKIKYYGLEPLPGTTIELQLDGINLYVNITNPSVSKGRKNTVNFNRTLSESWLPQVGGKIDAQIICDMLSRNPVEFHEKMRKAIFFALSTLYVQLVAPYCIKFMIQAPNFSTEINSREGSGTGPIAGYYFSSTKPIPEAHVSSEALQGSPRQPSPELEL